MSTGKLVGTTNSPCGIIQFPCGGWEIDGMRDQFLIVVVVVSLLGGCAPTVSGANQAGGIVEHVIGLNRDGAVKAADAHCKKYGKIARITEQNTLASTLVFECVAP